VSTVWGAAAAVSRTCRVSGATNVGSDGCHRHREAEDLRFSQVVPCEMGALAAVCALPARVALFFVRVNQVLVRHWARETGSGCGRFG
jgi:hypothetical protein